MKSKSRSEMGWDKKLYTNREARRNKKKHPKRLITKKVTKLTKEAE